MKDQKPAFVPLRSLKGDPLDVAAALAEIRQIYFKTSKKTIEHDLAHALELLKAMPTEDDRERATVYMHGLSEMARQWMSRSGTSGKSGRSGKSGKVTGKSKVSAPKAKK